MRVLIVLLGLVCLANAQTDTEKTKDVKQEKDVAYIARECSAHRSCRGMGEIYCCPNAEGVNYGCCHEDHTDYHHMDADSHGILPANGLNYHVDDGKPKTIHQAVDNVLYNIHHSDPWAGDTSDNWSAWSVPNQKTIPQAVDNILYNIHNSNPYKPNWSGWTAAQKAANAHVNNLASQARTYPTIQQAADNMIYNVQNSVPQYHSHVATVPDHSDDTWVDHFHRIIANKPKPPPEACCKRYWGCRKTDAEFCCPNEEGVYMECCNEPAAPHILLHHDQMQPPSIIPITNKGWPHPNRECKRYPGCAKNGEHLCCPNNEGIMMDCCHESHELHNVMNYDLHHIGTSIHYGEGKAVGALPAPQEARVGASSHSSYSHHVLYTVCALALLATLVAYCRHRSKGDNVYAQLEAKAVDEL